MIKQCEQCHKEIVGKKASALYCGNSCRTAANNQRRETERIKAENAKKQVEIEEAKRNEKEARRSKRAKKKDDLAEAKRKADIELEIQAEIDAWELNEKNRGIISIVGMLRVNAEATEKQRLEKEELKKKMDKIKLDYQIKKARERAELFANGIVEIFKNFSTPNKEPENPSKKQEGIMPPHQPQEPGDSPFPGELNSTNAELIPIDLPSFKGINGLGSPYEHTGILQYYNIKPVPPNKGLGIRAIFEDILDTIKGIVS